MPRFYSCKCHVSSRGNATSREKATYRGNATSREKATYRGNATSRRVEISISTEELGYTHAKCRAWTRV